MSFKEEVVAALEAFVAECDGNKTEAARRMGIPNYTTLHTWLAGSRSCISETLDIALTSIGCHVVRGERALSQEQPVYELKSEEEVRECLSSVQASMLELRTEVMECKAMYERFRKAMASSFGGEPCQKGKNVGS